MNKQERFDIIKGLWTLVNFANNGEAVSFTLMTGIPDGDTPDDWRDDIENDDDFFNDTLHCYMKAAKVMLKDGAFDPSTNKVFGCEYTAI